MHRRRALILTVAVAATALLLGRAISSVLVDRSWYVAMGASAVWGEKLIAVLLLKGGGWLVGTGFVFANLWSVRRTIRAIEIPVRVGDLEFAETVPSRQLWSITLGVSALIGILLTIPLDDWTVLSQAFRGAPFAEYEGFFQRDLAFYVYWLPFEEVIYTWSLIALVAVTALVTVLYSITRDLRLVDRHLIASTHVRRHLTALGSLVLLLLAWSYRLDAYELLLWGSGADGLFTRTDHVFTTRVDLVLAFGTFAAALIVLRSGWVGQVRAAFVTVTLVIIGALALRQAGPTVAANRRAASPNLAQDTDYVATRALFTRRAFDVAGVAYVPATARDDSTRDQTERTRTALEVARRTVVWDVPLLEQSRYGFESGTEARTASVWEAGPEGPQAVTVTRTNSSTPTWDVRVVSGTDVDARGTPLRGRHRQLNAAPLPEPLIAPGVTEHRVMRSQEFASLQTQDRESAGFARRSASPPMPPVVALSGMASRVAHAWATRDVSMLSSGSESDAVAVLMYRDVRERIARLLPVFAQGSVVIPVVTDGRLWWMLDLYSASESYPLSMRFQLAGAPRSYFRLAGAAMVDAATGRVVVVPVAAPDPIARLWFDRIPALLVPVHQLPEGLRQQLPIPTDGALAQLRAFARVGSALAGHLARFVPDSLPGGIPYPVGETTDGSGAISWRMPMLDDANQLTGVFEATSGAARGAAWRELPQPLPRWSALTSRLTTLLDSAALALRDDSDGPVSHGAIRTMLVDEQPVLLRPAYTTDATGVRLLAVASVGATGERAGRSNERLAAGELGDGVTDADRPLSPDERAREARRMYQAMRSALSQSDLVRFGALFDSLGMLLDRSP